MNEPETNVKDIRSFDSANKNQYENDKPFEEKMIVNVGGKLIDVPVTGIKTKFYNCIGFNKYSVDIPDTIDFERAIIYNGEIHTESPLSDVSVEMFDGGIYLINKPYNYDTDYQTVWDRS